MREVGITNSSAGLETTFETIIELSKDCKFNDCTHTNEKGCAILKAIENNYTTSNGYASNIVFSDDFFSTLRHSLPLIAVKILQPKGFSTAFNAKILAKLSSTITTVFLFNIYSDFI